MTILPKFLILFFVTLCLSIKSQAQQIYPIPQKTILKVGRIPYQGIQLKGKMGTHVSSVLASYVEKSGIPVRFKKSKKAIGKEGYELQVHSKFILINYTTERGAFYAAQSLKQLLDDAKRTSFLQKQTIQDFPDVAFRGTVEGFYGEPWSFEDRVAQLRFYGEWKMNTYLYGPKDDPYHSSPSWRETISIR
ncbi:beta-N-acetylglucosaminidase domain-containing protein [Sphingobacterium sp. SG20118]|uniref:beta-N-acetylglucosaminidase domain-containing protein n=1 Tax=Sphingobacterium sp. SG20118 TaxID=3367156 RepID=UPI0037DFBE01